MARCQPPGGRGPAEDRGSAGQPDQDEREPAPPDSDVVLLPNGEAEELIRSGLALRAGTAWPSWLVMPEPSDRPMLKSGSTPRIGPSC
jgi:hypothetical protein